jgi:DNA-binding IclR family transcriptional regulator
MTCRDRIIAVLRRRPLNGQAIVSQCTAWSTSTVRANLRKLVDEGVVVHDRQGGLWSLLSSKG